MNDALNWAPVEMLSELQMNDALKWTCSSNSTPVQGEIAPILVVPSPILSEGS
jgi:hypothetical protein